MKIKLLGTCVGQLPEVKLTFPDVVHVFSEVIEPIHTGTQKCLYMFL